MEAKNFTSVNSSIVAEVVFQQCYSNRITTYLVHPVKGDLKLCNIFLALINSIFAICGSFSNLFVILTYWRARDPSMKRISNMLVIALACSDLLVTALVQPLYILRKGYYEIYGIHNCVVFSILRLGIHFCCGISAMIAILVTAERYIAIAKPYTYPKLITRTRLKVTIVTISLAYLFIVSSRVWFVTLFVLTMVSSIIAISYLICTSSMWIHIFILARKHRKMITRQFEGVKIVDEYHKENSTIAYIMLCITVCSAPISILTTYSSIHGIHFRYLYIYLPWAETLVFFNSFANSAIFTWREKKYRQAFKRLTKLNRNSVTPVTFNTHVRKAQERNIEMKQHAKQSW